LDTVEEVSEPLSCSFNTNVDSLPADKDSLGFSAGRGAFSSSDYQAESLPQDEPPPPDTLSVTSKEEVFSVSEIEITYALRRDRGDGSETGKRE